MRPILAMLRPLNPGVETHFENVETHFEVDETTEKMLRPKFDGVETRFGHVETEVEVSRPILFVCVSEVMIDRGSWGHSCLIARSTAEAPTKEFFH